MKNQFSISFLLWLLPFYICSQENKINILNADILEYKKEIKDAQILKGNVILEHDGAIMSCDSAYVYTKTNSFEAFNNIKIVQNDSLEMRGDTLFYNGNNKKAEITGNVTFKEKDLSLSTRKLMYDLKAKRAYYNNRAHINSTKSQNKLTSKKGVYHSESKTLFFKDSVELTHPKYKMISDTLIYHTASEIADFKGPTTITSKQNTIFCNKGWYDTKNDQSSFWNNAMIISEEQFLSGDSIFYDSNLGVGKVYGNVILNDTSKKQLIHGDYAFHDENKDSSLVKGNALLSHHYQQDTLHILADQFISTNDSNNLNFLRGFNNVKFFKNDIQGICDSISYKQKDSIMELFKQPFLWSNENQISGDFIQLKLWNGTINKMNIYENSLILSLADSIHFNQIKGNNMESIFSENAIKSIYVKGNGETLYYIEKENKEPLADYNKTRCSELTIILDSNQIKTLNFSNQPTAKMNAITSTPTENKKLEGFIWNISERPLKIQFIRNEKLDIRE